MIGNVLTQVGLLWADIKLPVLMILGIMVGFFILTGIADGISGLIYRYNEKTDHLISDKWEEDEEEE